MNVEDAPRGSATGGGEKVALVRKLRLVAGEGTPSRVWLLLARDARIEADGAIFRVGKGLGIEVTGVEPVVFRGDEQSELRVPIPLGQQPSELSITYRWLEEGR